MGSREHGGVVATGDRLPGADHRARGGHGLGRYTGPGLILLPGANEPTAAQIGDADLDFTRSMNTADLDDGGEAGYSGCCRC
jgi:hypothetical protein